MDIHVCRACRGSAGHLVLDLGEQPACDFFPQSDDPGPDPVYPLQMWLCSSCGLAQLLADPTVPEEPRGTEPAALVSQAADAVHRVADAGWLPEGGVVAEYGSPHGGSWLDLLASRGLTPAADHGGQADVIIDCFGMMHAADQREALAERTARLAPGGVLLLQYHALSTIIGCGQWNALRHGHYAYYSTTTLTAMLAEVGFTPRTAWRFELYGGTALLAAARDGRKGPDEAVRSMLAEDTIIGVRDPGAFAGLQRDIQAHAKSLREWLAAQRSADKKVVGYGAVSRAVALLCQAHVDRDPAAHGDRRLAGHSADRGTNREPPCPAG
jgi:hypothetical protein